MKSFIYSVKVWLTSVGLAPLMYLIIELWSRNREALNSTDFIKDQVTIYAACVLFGGVFSIITWLLFFSIIKVITIYFPPMPRVKYGIAVSGSLLTFGTFAVFFRASGFGAEFYYLMISYGICIAGGSLFYNLGDIGDEEEIVT